MAENRYVPYKEQQKQKEADALAEFLGQQIRSQQQSATEGNQRQADLAAAVAMSKQLGPKQSVKVGEAAIGADPSERYLLMQQAQQDKLDMQKEKLVQNKATDLSKRYEKFADFMNNLNEIEQLTAKNNPQAGGGVLTSPDAKMISTGKTTSVIPTQAMGVAEMLGVVPKGTTDERKAAERLILSYQKAMTGLRPTDKARQQEKAAMGWIASGDPDLVSKGVRALGRSVRTSLQMVQSGYTPEVQDRVHSQFGNPIEPLNNIYDDNAHTAAPAQQGAPAAPQQQEQSGMGAPMSFEEFRARKKAGTL